MRQRSRQRRGLYGIGRLRERVPGMTGVVLFLELAAQMVGVVASIRDEPLETTGRCRDHLGRRLHVAGVARREVDNGGPPEDVGEDLDLGGLAAPRRSDGLRPRPPLPPCAERCALT